MARLHSPGKRATLLEGQRLTLISYWLLCTSSHTSRHGISLLPGSVSTRPLSARSRSPKSPERRIPMRCCPGHGRTAQSRNRHRRCLRWRRRALRVGPPKPQDHFDSYRRTPGCPDQFDVHQKEGGRRDRETGEGRPEFDLRPARQLVDTSDDSARRFVTASVRRLEGTLPKRGGRGGRMAPRGRAGTKVGNG
jgi:hypothetical protein